MLVYPIKSIGSKRSPRAKPHFSGGDKPCEPSEDRVRQLLSGEPSLLDPLLGGVVRFSAEN